MVGTPHRNNSPTEAIDKYKNSGGNKEASVWPTARRGAPRLRRKYYRLIATSRGGEETTRRCCAYTSLTEPHGGRVLWHIPPHRDGGGGAGGGEALAARAARVPVGSVTDRRPAKEVRSEPGAACAQLVRPTDALTKTPTALAGAAAASGCASARIRIAEVRQAPVSAVVLGSTIPRRLIV